MQQAKGLMDNLKEKVKSQLKKERTEAITTIQTLADKLIAMDNFQKLSSDEQAKLQSPFTTLEQEIIKQHLIAVIRDRVRSFEEGEYAKILAEVGRLIAASQKKKAEEKPKPDNPGKGGDDDKPPEAHEPEPEYIVGRTIKVDFARPSLDNENDLEEYLSLLKEAYLKEISAGKRVQI